MSFENDESLATELELFTENDGDLYRRMTEPILKNLTLLHHSYFCRKHLCWIFLSNGSIGGVS